MLLILIPVAWVALVAFFVALCRMAAWGDGAEAGRTGFPANDPARTIGVGLRVWSELDELVYGQRIPRRGVAVPAVAAARQPLSPRSGGGSHSTRARRYSR